MLLEIFSSKKRKLKRERYESILTTNYQFAKIYLLLYKFPSLECEDKIMWHISNVAKYQYLEYLWRDIVTLCSCALLPLMASILEKNLNVISVFIIFPLAFVLPFLSLNPPRFIKRNYVLSYLIMNVITTFNYIGIISGKDICEKINEDNAEAISKIIKNIQKYKEIAKKENEEKPNSVYLYFSFDDIKYRKAILILLENCAKGLEIDLVRAFSTRDIFTNQWFKTKMKQSANAIREKKKWVLTPKEDTYYYLTQSIIATFNNIISGNWDALERIELGADVLNSMKKRDLLGKTINFIKTTVLSLLPLTIFIILKTMYLVSTPLDTYIILGLIIWASITFLVRYDKDTVTKFSLLKDTKDLLTLK